MEVDSRDEFLRQAVRFDWPSYDVQAQTRYRILSCCELKFWG